jgi:hypothetical protein
VRTDHGSLRWLLNFKNPEGQLARWLRVLNSYDMTIVHRPGRQHRNADALSRIPCRQCGFHLNWENTENRAQHARNIQERETQEHIIGVEYSKPPCQLSFGIFEVQKPPE